MLGGSEDCNMLFTHRDLGTEINLLELGGVLRGSSPETSVMRTEGNIAGGCIKSWDVAYVGGLYRSGCCFDVETP